MPFSESIKLAVKRKAHLKCCVCEKVGVEIHHIQPEGEGGANTEDNAAPLCPGCHDIYGANREKRKFIRECRDFWYELCAKRFQEDPAALQEIIQRLDSISARLPSPPPVTPEDDLLAKLIAALTAVQNQKDPDVRNATVQLLQPVLDAAAVAFARVRDEAIQKTIHNNLRQLYAATMQFVLENGRYPKHLDEIVGPNGYIRSITSVDGERYDNVQFDAVSELRVVRRSGEVVTYTM